MPNTLPASCNEYVDPEPPGTTEAIDRIVVSSPDGQPLAPGRPAQVDVDMSGAQENDLVYLFYTAEADSSNVRWEPMRPEGPFQLTTAGDTTVSATYTLPAGGVQAVRAALIQPLSQSQPVTPCITEYAPLEDHDDVVFAVNTGN